MSVRTGSQEPRSAEERVAHVLAISACVFFAAVALWEVAGPIPGGHFGSSAAAAIAGENMLQWHKFAVVPDYSPGLPPPDRYYCHHPYGIYIMAAFARLVFGHHWFTVRMPAVLCSIFSAPLVYLLGRAMWGIIPAAFATILFVVMPIDLAFSSFTNLEVPGIFFGLLFSWGTVRLWQTWRRRWIAVAAAGALGVAQADWVGLVFLAVIVGFSFMRVYVFPQRWYGRVNERRHAQWFAYAAAAAVGTFVLYIVLFVKVDHLTDLLDSYSSRTDGAGGKWDAIFTPRRKQWVAWMITRIGIGTILAGFPLSWVRLTRRPAEIIPIAWTMAATFEYFVFNEAAEVHIFWPHLYGPATALAGGVIVASLLWARRRFVDVWSPERRVLVGRVTGALLAVLMATPLVLLTRMTLPQLVQSRKTSGRYDDGGRFIETEADAAQFSEWATRGTPPDTVLSLHSIPGFNFAGQYGGHRTIRLQDGPNDPLVIADARAMTPTEMSAIAKKSGVQIVGGFWRIDRKVKGPKLTALHYDEHQPGPLEWLFVSGTDLVRTIGPDADPFATWEWDNALGLDASTPSAAPGTFDEIRIAHNIAIARGDEKTAASLRARLLEKAGHVTDYAFTNDLHLIAEQVDTGSAVVVTFLWEAGKDFKKFEGYFDVKCKVTAKPPLWMSDTDFLEKDMSPTPIFRPSMYKARFLYAQRFIALHRIGTEECTGSFPGGNPHLVNGAPEVKLFTLR